MQGGTGSIPSQGTKIPHGAMQRGKKERDIPRFRKEKQNRKFMISRPYLNTKGGSFSWKGRGISNSNPQGKEEFQ